MMLRLLRMGPFLILVALAGALWLLNPVFLSQINIQNLLIQSSVVAILALGQLVVILTRGIDLSVGSGIALASVLGALAFRSDALDSGVAVMAVMIATGVGLGLVNGLVYIVGRLPHPFIVTLATFGIANGLALTIAKGQSLPGTPGVVSTLGFGFVGVVPVAIIVVAAVASIVAILMRRTQWGRWVYATGGSPEAAERVGIPVSRLLISVYVFSGVMVGIAAILTSGQIAGGSPTVGQLSMLDAIAAVIIGGASFLGGHGRVWNALVGAFTLATIRNGLSLQGVSPYAEYVVVGATILLAVELDVLRTRLERRVRALRASEAAL